MKLDDIVIHGNSKVVNNNLDAKERRKEYPIDYFELSKILLQSTEPVVRAEIFKTIYKALRSYIPDTVYKYYPLGVDDKADKQRLDTLYREKIFLSDVSGFNDPFDGKGFFYNPKELSKIERLKECDGKLVDDFTKYVKVSCFTGEGVQSMPMWAHYANNHQGFCVAYDTKTNPDLNMSLFPVQYSSERLDISSEMKAQAQKINDEIEKNVENGNLITLYNDGTIVFLALLLFNVKDVAWSYEDEYRCVFSANSKGMPFIKARPKSIYIGNRCSDNNAKRLYDIADSFDANIFKMESNSLDEKCKLAYSKYIK